MNTLDRDYQPAHHRLHVLVVANYWSMRKEFPYAGIFVERQLDSLRKAGVIISCFDIGLDYSPFKILGKWIELRRKVREIQPHLIHGQYGTIVGFLSVLAGRPAVISFCGSDLQPGDLVSALRMWFGFLLSNLAALRARKLICKSEGLRKALWWRQDRAVVIPHGVDLHSFVPGSQDEARKALNWHPEHPIVLFNAGMDDPKKKGLDLTEACMKVVRSRIPNAQLHVINKVEPNCMPIYYRAADVLLCASKYEGSPNVVKEALACNLPVVSTPVGDVPERLAGVYPSEVVARDPTCLGEALTRILLLRIRSNGREHVGNLEWACLTRRVLEVYHEITCTQ